MDMDFKELEELAKDNDGDQIENGNKAKQSPEKKLNGAEKEAVGEKGKSSLEDDIFPLNTEVTQSSLHETSSKLLNRESLA